MEMCFCSKIRSDDLLQSTKEIQNIIRTRLDRVSLGNFGDYKLIGQGIYELRFHIHGGHRIYFSQDGKRIILLLCGGDKSSQTKDIKIAKKYLEDYRRRQNEI